MSDTNQASSSPSPAAAAPASAGSAPADAGPNDWGALADGGPSQDSSSAPMVAPSGEGDSPAREPVAAQQVEPPAPVAPPEPPPVAEPQAATVEEQPPIALDPNWQSERLADLTKGYTFSAEQAEQFHEDPVAALPALASQVHMKVLLHAAHLVDHFVTNNLPKLIQQQLGQRDMVQAAKTGMEQHVFAHFPMLREMSPEDLGFLSKRVAAALPKATLAERVSELGRRAYLMNGWPLPGATAPSSAQQPQRSAPYAPVLPGAGGGNGPLSGGSDNPFASLID